MLGACACITWNQLQVDETLVVRPAKNENGAESVGIQLIRVPHHARREDVPRGRCDSGSKKAH